MLATKWAFTYRTKEGEVALTDVRNFGWPLCEGDALTWFPKWVRDHVISGQCFDDDWDQLPRNY